MFVKLLFLSRLVLFEVIELSRKGKVLDFKNWLKFQFGTCHHVRLRNSSGRSMPGAVVNRGASRTIHKCFVSSKRWRMAFCLCSGELCPAARWTLTAPQIIDSANSVRKQPPPSYTPLRRAVFANSHPMKRNIHRPPSSKCNTQT